MEIWLYVVSGIAVSGLGFWVLSRKRKPAEKLPAASAPVEVTQPAEPVKAAEKVESVQEVSAPVPTLGDRLGKTRHSLFGRLEKFFGKKALDAKEWEELEEILLEADVGLSTTTKLLQAVKESQQSTNSDSDFKVLVRAECERILKRTLISNGGEKPKPWVISIVGVNGVGKTTTIGKLTRLFKSEGKSVLLGAADTFRAGAINQLKTWAEREGAQFVTGREGGDPGAVAFDSLTAAKARGIDVVLLDTAGRLHTKTDLMEELKKVHRVMKKVIPEAPHETWLVLDGNLGQNSVHQAREFQKALELTGVIVTKLDGTAKGGAVLSIASDLGLPVKFIGVGESSADFIKFDASAFVDAIVSG